MKVLPIELSQVLYKRWNRYLNELIAHEVSRSTRYFDAVVQVKPLRQDSEHLLETVDCIKKIKESTLPELKGEKDRRTAVLLNGNLNHHFDIEGLLSDLKTKLSRTSRVICVSYNPYLAWLYKLANAVGLRTGELPTTFLTRTDLHNVAKLSGYEVIRVRPVGFFPVKLLGLGAFLNSLLSSLPFFRWFAYVNVISLRPVIAETTKPSLSIVIPARNEKGNIENALKRMPDLGAKLEILFIEGHSKDGTWEEIQRVAHEYKNKFSIQCFQQTGKGKSDAVRLGFSKATGDLLTILDADLTMPPELLGRFYEAYCRGSADFINGTRLLYPMEGDAMRFLNRLGNIFFAKALSWVLDSKLGDSLCGTKLVARHDYERMIAWRKDFGDFDPFGDFELLFPAAVLALGITDIPIRYRARTYGSTNISRFRHGFMLLRMTLIGFFRIRMG